MQATVQQLASLIQGTVHGNADLVVHSGCPLTEAGPGDVTFLENERHLRQLKGCKATALVVPASLVPRLTEIAPLEGRAFAVIEAVDPLLAFVAIVQHLRGPTRTHSPGVSPQASVHALARLGADCTVLPFAVIGEGSVIGAAMRDPLGGNHWPGLPDRR